MSDVSFFLSCRSTSTELNIHRWMFFNFLQGQIHFPLDEHIATR